MKSLSVEPNSIQEPCTTTSVIPPVVEKDSAEQSLDCGATKTTENDDNIVIDEGEDEIFEM